MAFFDGAGDIKMAVYDTDRFVADFYLNGLRVKTHVPLIPQCARTPPLFHLVTVCLDVCLICTDIVSNENAEIGNLTITIKINGDDVVVLTIVSYFVEEKFRRFLQTDNMWI